jgi:hypothetical protein
VLEAGRLTVRDRLTGRGEAVVELRFTCRGPVRRDGAHAVRLGRKGARLALVGAIHGPFGDPAPLSLVRTSAPISRAYGRTSPGAQVTWTGRVKLPARFDVVLRWATDHGADGKERQAPSPNRRG